MERQGVAVVAAGLGAMGTALCQRLAQAGFKVAALYGAGEAAPAAWQSIQRDQGWRVTAYPIDLGDYGACEWLVQRILKEQGGLDVLVQQAAEAAPQPLGAIGPRDWLQVLRASLDGAYNLGKPALEPMLAQRRGRIVHIVPWDGGAVHGGAARSGIHGFTKALALEVAKQGVTVNTVAPGPMGDSGNPVGRPCGVDDVAAAVAYLVSEEAAYMSGALLPVNGGAHMV